MAPSINEKELEKETGGTNAPSTKSEENVGKPEDAAVDAEESTPVTPPKEAEAEGSWADYKVSLEKSSEMCRCFVLTVFTANPNLW